MQHREETQAAVKQGGHTDFLVGQDFAVVPVNGRTVRELAGCGRWLVTSTPIQRAELRTEPTLVGGCVLSNHVPAA